MAFVRVNVPRTSQPQDLCSIDWTNPITRDIAIAVSGDRDHLGRQSLVTTGVALRPGIAGVGMQAPSTAVGQGAAIPGPVRLRTSSGDFAGDFTLLQLAAPSSAGGVQAGFYSADENGSFRFASLLYNSTNSTASSPGSFVFATYNGGWNGNSVPLTGVVDGGLHLFFVRRMDGAQVHGLDGAVLQSSAASTRWIGQDARTPRIAGNHRTDKGLTSTPAFLTIGFNRGLSDDELKSLYYNPWQIFEPEETLIWVPEGADDVPILPKNLHYYNGITSNHVSSVYVYNGSAFIKPKVMLWDGAVWLYL